MNRHTGAHDVVERVTIQEASRRLGKSEKTIRRWVHQEKLHPVTIEGKFLFAVQELKDVLEAEKPGPTPEERIEALQAEVDALEQRVSELERKLDELSAGQKPYAIKTSRPRILRETASEQPAGETVTARKFAEDHGFTRWRMDGWIRDGEIKATPKTYGNKIQYVLTVEQQQAALDFWQSLEGSE